MPVPTHDPAGPVLNVGVGIKIGEGAIIGVGPTNAQLQFRADFERLKKVRLVSCTIMQDEVENIVWSTHLRCNWPDRRSGCTFGVYQSI